MKKSYLYIMLGMIFIVTACTGAAPEATPIPPTATEKPIEVLYTLKVSADPAEGGAVAPSEDQLPAGTKVQIQAKPAPGYKFEVWSGSDSSTSPDMTVTMDKDKTLTAHFSKLATNTPMPPTITPTPEHSPTPEVEPTSDNPYLLTDWCLEHVGCEKFTVKNQSTFAIGIYLRHEDSGAAKDFYCPPKGNIQITLPPGRYYYIFTTCNGGSVYDGYHHLSGKWYWLQKEKFCK